MANNTTVTSTTVNNLIPVVRELTKKYNDLSAKYDALVSSIGSGEQSTLTQLASRVNTMSGTIDNLRTRINSINLNNYVKQADYNVLANAQLELSNKVSNTASATKVTSDVSYLTATLNQLRSDVELLRTDLNLANAAAEEHEASVDTRINTITNSYPTASELRSAIALANTNKRSIASINTQIASQQGTLDRVDGINNLLLSTRDQLLDEISKRVPKSEYQLMVNDLNTRATQAQITELYNYLRNENDETLSQLQNVENWAEALYLDSVRKISPISYAIEFLLRNSLSDEEARCMDLQNAIINEILGRGSGDVAEDLNGDGIINVDDLNANINKILEIKGQYFNQVYEFLNGANGIIATRKVKNIEGDNSSNYMKYEYTAYNIAYLENAELSEYIPSYLNENLRDELNSTYSYLLSVDRYTYNSLFEIFESKFGISEQDWTTLNRMVEAWDRQLFAVKSDVADLKNTQIPIINLNVRDAKSKNDITYAYIKSVGNDVLRKIDAAEDNIRTIDNKRKDLTLVAYQLKEKADSIALDLYGDGGLSYIENNIVVTLDSEGEVTRSYVNSNKLTDLSYGLNSYFIDKSTSRIDEIAYATLTNNMKAAKAGNILLTLAVKKQTTAASVKEIAAEYREVENPQAQAVNDDIQGEYGG